MVLAFAWIPLRVPSEEGTGDDRFGSKKFFQEVVKSWYSIEYNYLFILFNFVTWQGIFITFEHVKNIGND